MCRAILEKKFYLNINYFTIISIIIIIIIVNCIVTFAVERRWQRNTPKVFVFQWLNVNGLIVYYQPCIFCPDSAITKCNKNSWRYLSEFSQQIVLNGFEQEFHVMASFSWPALFFRCRTLLQWLCEALRKMFYRCILPVAHCDKIHIIKRMPVKCSTWKSATWLSKHGAYN